MIHLLAIMVCAAGFAAFAVAMDRHQRDLVGRKLSPLRTRIVRAAGGIFLAVALVTDIVGMGVIYGSIVWFGHLSLSAAIVLTWITRNASARKSKGRAGTTR